MSDFQSYSSSKFRPVLAIATIAVLIAAFVYLLCRLYAFVTGLLPDLCISEARWPKLESAVFWLYVLLFVSMWTTYFISKSGPSWLRVPSLRRLLLQFSEQWSPTTSDKQDTLIEEYRKKATSGISSMAMLAAAAGLELAQANLIVSTLKQPLTKEESVIVLIAVMCGFISLLCFILASDALDSMFNKFKTDQVKHQLIHRFYFHSIYTRYFGFVLLLCGAIFLIAFHSRLLGAAAAGLVFAIGYSYWFPRKDLVSTSDSVEAATSDGMCAWVKSWPWALMLRLLLGAGVPIALFINGAFYHCP